MICPKCGNTISIEEYKCSECGLEIPVKSREERIKAEEFAEKMYKSGKWVLPKSQSSRSGRASISETHSKRLKSITCEMCGSHDILKENGLFVCQHCGCKYTVEEARKLMVEGTVDIQGTVTIDNTDLSRKSLLNARRAKEKEDWEETEKYYNIVEQNDPHNIEAIFYSSYGKAKTTLVEADIYKRQAAFKVLQNCVSIIDDNYEIEREEENKTILSQISADIIAMACGEFVYTQTTGSYGIVLSDNRGETVKLFNLLGFEFITTLENIAVATKVA